MSLHFEAMKSHYDKVFQDMMAVDSCTSDEQLQARVAFCLKITVAELAQKVDLETIKVKGIAFEVLSIDGLAPNRNEDL